MITFWQNLACRGSSGCNRAANGYVLAAAYFSAGLVTMVMVLEAVLRRAFAQRLLKPEPDLYPYLVARLPRSAAEAIAAADLLDEEAASRKRELNKALAREVLEGFEGEDEL